MASKVLSTLLLLSFSTSSCLAFVPIFAQKSFVSATSLNLKPDHDVQSSRREMFRKVASVLVIGTASTIPFDRSAEAAEGNTIWFTENAPKVPGQKPKDKSDTLGTKKDPNFLRSISDCKVCIQNREVLCGNKVWKPHCYLDYFSFFFYRLLVRTVSNKFCTVPYLLYHMNTSSTNYLVLVQVHTWYCTNTGTCTVRAVSRQGLLLGSTFWGKRSTKS